MSIDTEELRAADVEPDRQPVTAAAEDPQNPELDLVQERPGLPRVPALTTTLAAGASSAGAAWMVAGIFRDFSAHFVALGGILLGTGLVMLSLRARRGAWIQYLVIPLAILLGAVLVSADTPGAG